MKTISWRENWEKNGDKAFLFLFLAGIFVSSPRFGFDSAVLYMIVVLHISPV
jgi:hypothetical protein